MRRTASLSIFAEQKQNNLANVDHLFSINKKCILELGIINKVPKLKYLNKDKQGNLIAGTIDYQELYGDIIWFPLGFFVMFNPSIAHGMDGVTISMQLKDKMCLLNGDIGGEIHSAVEFNYQDQIVDKNSLSIEKNPVLIYNIIKQLVNHWGNEKLENIIISEVPLWIKKVVKWRGNSNIWLYHTSPNNYLLTPTKPEDGFDQQFEPGQDMGFIYDEFTYPGQLTCNAGDTVTSVLDKIIGVMGNYEYFYDVFGKFRFQQKQNYLNMTNVAYWTKETTQEQKVGNLPSDVYKADYRRLTKSIYDFTDNEYTTTYNNSLNYNNIKNDFVVWGGRKGVTGNVLPCRFHLAVDKIPDLNVHYNIVLFDDDFQVTRGLKVNNKQVSKGDTITWIDSQYTVKEVIPSRESQDWRQEIYYQMLEDEQIGTGQATELNNTYFQYYAELKEQFPKIFDLNTQTYKVDIKQHPEDMEYYLDFIDENSQLGGYSVSNIGRRAKIIDGNNEGINCVFEPNIPDIVYLDATRPNIDEKRAMAIAYGQKCTQIPSAYYNLFDIGGILNSCFEKIKDLLYQYTHVNNTISITTLPIYYLEPNTRITVEDKAAGIYGDYIIQSISLPLDISSTMNINAYQALQKI